MFDRINKELEQFTTKIKNSETCDEMIITMNSNLFSSIKLLMDASKTFFIYVKVLISLIIFIMGLVSLSSMVTMSFNDSYLIVVNIVLFVLLLLFVMHFKKVLYLSIGKVRASIKKNKEN